MCRMRQNMQFLFRLFAYTASDKFSTEARCSLWDKNWTLCKMEINVLLQTVENQIAMHKRNPNLQIITKTTNIF